jgi:hypothetical protein
MGGRNAFRERLEELDKCRTKQRKIKLVNAVMKVGKGQLTKDGNPIKGLEKSNAIKCA